MTEPNWIKVTDNPSTWPPMEVVIVARDSTHEFLAVRTKGEDGWVFARAEHIEWDRDKQHLTCWDAFDDLCDDVTHWRPI